MTTTTQDKLNIYKSTHSSNQRTEEDSREIDRRALLSCATRLTLALNAGGTDMKAYAEAIRNNQRLWTIFQVALCDPENPLPKHVKVTLLNLSRYVDRTSFRAVSEFMPQLITSLIDINRAIASGLAKNLKEKPLAPAQSLTPPSSVMTSA